MSGLLFLLECLSVWRFTHIFSKEDGPFDLIFRLRKAAGSGFFGSLLDCFYCTSVWVSLPFGLWTGHSWREKLLIWAALSGGACLLEQATEKKNNNQDDPVYFEENEK